RGSLTFLQSANRKVLAYLRCFEGEHVLCVANLSRFAQPVELDLASLEGMRPIEMLGYVEFQAIGRGLYPLTLAPYGFLWFELHKSTDPDELSSGESEDTSLPIEVSDGWKAVFSGSARQELESRCLPDYLPKQRWFGGKARRIQGVSVADWVEIDPAIALALLQVRYEDQSADTYFTPLALSFGVEAER